MEAILLTLCIFSSIFLINILLSNYLLPKAIREKKLGVFWGQFIGLTLLMGLIMVLILAAFRQLELSGFFSPSNLFSDSDSFWVDFKNQMPASIVINLAIVGLRFYYEHMRLEKIHLESELQALKAQINPHFMFNVLNHIYYYVKNKDDIAPTLLLNYSDILRYQLYCGQQKDVNLEEELQFLKNFINIETIRWEDKLDINCLWKIENTSKRIPPLLLIPLIENAFKHVSRSSNDKGYININFEQKESMICLEVENSKLAIPVNRKEQSGLGLENLKNRLEILLHNKYSLSIQETETKYNSKLVIQI
ncbi:sensor histidine kinase [Dysgonomonas sp. ZJ709]|uniref:sensor histidine kinase n=1 Tax=Dysgonomonas sp. ZJ709 TaxID=2709797 RepID=UPI0013EC3B6E|nr:histidine kinase [Dysgonomonas sp. ZJ709]